MPETRGEGDSGSRLPRHRRRPSKTIAQRYPARRAQLSVGNRATGRSPRERDRHRCSKAPSNAVPFAPEGDAVAAARRDRDGCGPTPRLRRPCLVLCDSTLSQAAAGMTADRRWGEMLRGQSSAHRRVTVRAKCSRYSFGRTRTERTKKKARRFPREPNTRSPIKNQGSGVRHASHAAAPECRRRRITLGLGNLETALGVGARRDRRAFCRALRRLADRSRQIHEIFIRSVAA